jgi:hypothetical protein
MSVSLGGLGSRERALATAAPSQRSSGIRVHQHEIETYDGLMLTAT